MPTRRELTAGILVTLVANAIWTILTDAAPALWSAARTMNIEGIAAWLALNLVVFVVVVTLILILEKLWARLPAQRRARSELEARKARMKNDDVVRYVQPGDPEMEKIIDDLHVDDTPPRRTIALNIPGSTNDLIEGNTFIGFDETVGGKGIKGLRYRKNRAIRDPRRRG